MALIGQDSTASGLANPPMTFGVWGDSGNGAGVVGSSSNPARAACSVRRRRCLRAQQRAGRSRDPG